MSTVDTFRVETLRQAGVPVAEFPCPPWCDSDCLGQWAGAEGDRYHASGFEMVQASVFDSPDTTMSTSVTRIDTPDAEGTPEIHLITGDGRRDEYILNAGQARKLAAMLLNAADLAEPLPVRVAHIPAEDIRVGDEIDTPDGWQTVYQTTVDARSRFVAAFTDERDDTDTDGWQYEFGDPLIVRRAQVARARRRTVTR